MENSDDMQCQIAELKRLPERIVKALHSDLECGTKALNERAKREFRDNYPELSAVIELLNQGD